MSTFKVCHMSSVHHGLDTRIFHKECCSLADNSYDVALVIGASDEDVHLAKSRSVSLIRLDRIEGRFKRMLLQGYRCYRKALGTRSDIYHLHDPELIPFGVLLRLRGKKVVYDVHEDLPRDILLKDWIPPLFRKSLSRFISGIEFIVASSFFEVITATPFILKRFKKANARAVNINNFPLDIDIPEEFDRPCGGAAICYVGGITKLRGVGEILDALNILQGEARLHLAGNFVDQGFEKSLLSHPAWQRVEWHGYVDRAGVRRILSQSMAGLVTLHPTATFTMSLPVKLFEYMACGLPVIASDFPLWNEIITKHKCGILVDPKCPQQIAEAISYCLENRDLAEEMGNNGRAAVLSEYNWRSEERKLIQFYRELHS